MDACFKKKTNWGPQKLIFGARVVNPWNELYEKTVTVYIVEKFKRKLSEFGYWDMEGVLTQTVVF